MPPPGCTGSGQDDTGTIRFGDHDFTVLALRPGRLSSFEAMLDLLAERARRDQLTIIENDLPSYGADPKLDGFLGHVLTFLDSVGTDVAILPVSASSLCIPDDPGFTSPHLLSNPATVRYICSFAADPDMFEDAKTSTPVRRDFSAFAHLWAPSGIAADPGAAGFRILDGVALGRLMGRLHEICVMWIDAHIDQFGFSGFKELDRAFIYDLGWMWPLYRKPTAAQCATSFAPLLPVFDTAYYEGFARGYWMVRHEAAERVFDYMESDDHTGWSRAYSIGDFSTAAEKAREQLDERPEDPDYKLLRFIGICHARQGDQGQARMYFEESAALLEAGSTDLPGLRYNIALTYFNAGQYDAAARVLREVIRLEEARVTSSQVLAKARTRLADSLRALGQS
jgi:hypothetical protein